MTSMVAGKSGMYATTRSRRRAETLLQADSGKPSIALRSTWYIHTYMQVNNVYKPET